MNRKTNALLSILAALGIPMLAPSLVNAGEEQTIAANSTYSDRGYQIPSYSDRDREQLLSQTTSISEFRDVSPNAWSFEALRNLVEDYGCIAGYPDRTYRGDRALTRYEFAAGMNACLQAFERRMLEGRGTTPNQTTPQTATSQDSLNEVFERAFFHNMNSFYESTGILDQLNTQLGISPFKVPAAFPENQIARDGELLHEIYKDALQQQSSLPRMRTRDLPNPFDTSLLENPGYTRPAASDGRRELIIEQMR
jgi:S-layer homology domain